MLEADACLGPVCVVSRLAVETRGFQTEGFGGCEREGRGGEGGSKGCYVGKVCRVSTKSVCVT